MIKTLPMKKPDSRKPTKARSVVSKESSGAQEQQEKQVIKPELDSAALNRRAKELSTEMKWGSVVEQNNEKVDRIKAEIEAGTYEVDADAIADRLLECEFNIIED